MFKSYKQSVDDMTFNTGVQCRNGLLQGSTLPLSYQLFIPRCGRDKETCHREFFKCRWWDSYCAVCCNHRKNCKNRIVTHPVVTRYENERIQLTLMSKSRIYSLFNAPFTASVSQKLKLSNYLRWYHILILETNGQNGLPRIWTRVLLAVILAVINKSNKSRFVLIPPHDGSIKSNRTVQIKNQDQYMNLLPLSLFMYTIPCVLWNKTYHYKINHSIIR